MCAGENLAHRFGRMGQKTGTGHSLVVVTEQTPRPAGETEEHTTGNSRAPTVRGSIAVAVVLLLAGGLFVTNIRYQEGDGERGPSNLAEAILAECERVEQRRVSVSEVREVVDV